MPRYVIYSLMWFQFFPQISQLLHLGIILCAKDIINKAFSDCISFKIHIEVLKQPGNPQCFCFSGFSLNTNGEPQRPLWSYRWLTDIIILSQGEINSTANNREIFPSYKQEELYINKKYTKYTEAIKGSGLYVVSS